MGSEELRAELGTGTAGDPQRFTPTESSGRAARALKKRIRRERFQAILARVACVYAPLVLVNFADLGLDGWLPFLWLMLWVPAMPGCAVCCGLPGPAADPWIAIPFVSALFLGMAISAARAQGRLRHLWFALAIGVSTVTAMLWREMLLR